ncbi:hypothetical protein J4467_02365 [Candidatus Woesearchaeota archaeon]|nr:hypothetical protein [Candidatus Woesearchaeota archaeon]
MVALDYINFGVSFLVLIAQIIYSYFNKKEFLDRFNKYNDDLNSKIKKKIFNWIQEVSPKIAMDKDSQESIDFLKNFAEELEKDYSTKWEFYDAQKRMKLFYIAIFSSILLSCFSLLSPSSLFLGLELAKWSLILLICSVSLLFWIIYSLQGVNQKVIAYEINIKEPK